MSTHVFTSEEILESIAAWQAIISNSAQLIKALEQGNTFTYDNIKQAEPTEYIHAYPGIFEDKLYFFVIPDAYDNEAYKDEINLHTQCRPVIWTLMGSHTIPDWEAELRIARWIEHYQAFVVKQVSDPVGMFKAFNIPADDFAGDECLATLGLQLQGAEGPMSADLIVANANDKTLVEFDDFVNPVPPFGAAALESSFYLLQAAASI
ncbi:hypothetical protein OGH69_08690 [Flavobacterium sp. MFBS3-15]|uniref:hypothetical protein n=1 Tax=Flavobacterium sp. MFBS3-15 TaxID=2989816 RepID=UPI002235737F|nr:hypothetical protein [Flavobacterium sp. MFBS3-15]MCW4469038.1 hypothetical protein [Flavobacterium sp. MFBS3-15]